MTETVMEGDEHVGSATEMDVGRVLALSDGVFAIAATLLVLELRLPEGIGDADLPEKLHELLPAFGGYGLSYLLIGLLWLGHRRLFHNFNRVSERVARLNLLFLALIGVLPFVTSLLRYDAAIAVTLYAGTIAVIFALEISMAIVASHRGHHFDMNLARVFSHRAFIAAVVFAVSIPVAWIPGLGPDLAKYFWLLFIPLRIVRRLITRSPGRRGR
jgi:TMEM175 potassium channel family protein